MADDDISAGGASRADVTEPSRAGAEQAGDGAAEPASGGASGGASERGSGAAGECLPCRGTGIVISGLGGTRTELSCPWCRGSGKRTVGVDAQERWAGAGDGAGAGNASGADAHTRGAVAT